MGEGISAQSIGGIGTGTGFTSIANAGQKAWPDGGIGMGAALTVSDLFAGNEVWSVLKYRSGTVTFVANRRVRKARADLGARVRVSWSSTLVAGNEKVAL